MSAPTILTPMGTRVRLVTPYEFLTSGMEGVLQEVGWTNPPESQRTLIINMGEGTIELDLDNFSLFEIVEESIPADPVRLI